MVYSSGAARFQVGLGATLRWHPAESAFDKRRPRHGNCQSSKTDCLSRLSCAHSRGLILHQCRLGVSWPNMAGASVLEQWDCGLQAQPPTGRWPLLEPVSRFVGTGDLRVAKLEGRQVCTSPGTSAPAGHYLWHSGTCVHLPLRATSGRAGKMLSQDEADSETWRSDRWHARLVATGSDEQTRD